MKRFLAFLVAVATLAIGASAHAGRWNVDVYVQFPQIPVVVYPPVYTGPRPIVIYAPGAPLPPPPQVVYLPEPVYVPAPTVVYVPMIYVPYYTDYPRRHHHYHRRH